MGFVFELLISLLLEILLKWTGETLRFVFSLGRHRPIFALLGIRGLFTNSSSSTASIGLGLVFWAVVVGAFISWTRS